MENAAHASQVFCDMVGTSLAMREVFNAIRQVGPSSYTVLITGESGTGKELAARAVHRLSGRRNGPLVPVNCGALPEHVLESELFGHVRGAFTGAIRDRQGRFQLADGGTLFLDEVDELSPAFQVKLLRVLEQKSLVQVGGERELRTDVRLVCATNRDLRKLVGEGSFREDLFFRLSVFPIRLPPLRERKEDLPLLIEHVLAKLRRELGRPIRGLEAGALEMLSAHSWPGNVRELINALQFASVRCPGGDIAPRHLPPEVRKEPSPAAAAEAPAPRFTALHHRGRRKLDREAVVQVLADCGGNRSAAARRLGVGRATLYRFLARQARTAAPFPGSWPKHNAAILH